MTKMSQLLQNTFKSLHHQLGHDRPCDMRPFWQRRLSTSSAFCQALVANGYMTTEQMKQATLLYRLGMSRKGGVEILNDLCAFGGLTAGTAAAKNLEPGRSGVIILPDRQCIPGFLSDAFKGIW